ncbi:hypothetical protein Tco_0654645 [Tanacetum coccineum]|uniref:Uncharacterized protein n=1 Tax=Tanacetum coccineum TaxID=301880 RepID=A0ABQ4X3S8_9ASTR
MMVVTVGWRWWRVAKSEYGDRVDLVVRTTFGFDRKSPPENFSGGGGVAAVVAGVTYTQISSPFADLSDIGSTGVDGSPMMLEEPYAYIVATYQAPPSPDYMSGPEEPQSPPPLDFVPEPMYHKYMPLKDEILPAEEQPLPAAATPTADSPGYVPEFDPEEEPEAEDDEDPEEDPVDYLANRDDDDEEEKEEPSEDDVDDEDEDEDKDEEEEEEHPAPADFIPPVHRMTARISIQDEPFISLPPRE